MKVTDLISHLQQSFKESPTSCLYDWPRKINQLGTRIKILDAEACGGKPGPQ